MDSRVVRIQELFAAFKDGGMTAVAALIEPDAEFWPLPTEEKVYHGPQGLEAFARDVAARGEELVAEPAGFEALDDCIVVPGRLRTRRDEGSLTESQVTWIYRFNGDELAAMRAFPGRLTHAEAAERCAELRPLRR